MHGSMTEFLRFFFPFLLPVGRRVGSVGRIVVLVGSCGGTGCGVAYEKRVATRWWICKESYDQNLYSG